MAKYTTQDIRNIVLAGHAGAGKTTLAEALLHAAGAINTKGSIDKGSTVCDYDPLEKDHQHSLAAAIAGLDHDGKHITIIDSPGLSDFQGHALSALPAAETAAIVVSAASGIETMTMRMAQRAAEAKLCRIIVVNKIDSDGADLSALVTEIREAFGNECLPINLPNGDKTGVLDCFFNPSGEAGFSSIEEAHSALVDQIVEVDEALMELYLEQGEVSLEQLQAPFAKALREGHLVPICFVSAATGAGCKELLDVLARLMPNPLEANPRTFRYEGGQAEDISVEPDSGKQMLAHVFKVTPDPFMGKVGVFRIHQGTLSKGDQIYIGTGRKPVKVSHLFKLQGRDHKEVDSAGAGEICAVTKVDEIVLDAALQATQATEVLKIHDVSYPKAMFGLAIEAKSRGDETKLSGALQKLSAEDPCFVVERASGTNELCVRGLGELHLRVMLEKMKSRYNVEVTTRPPKIAYRETVSGKAEGHHRHKKQTGGAGQFGEVYLRIEPRPRGEGFEFANDIFGGAIPSQFVPAVEKGVRQVLESGAIAGYPFQDVKVSVYDGKHHPVDSNEVSFVQAGRKAFLEAIGKAKPLILEPIVTLEVTVPESNMGDVTGDLSSRRGRIKGTDSHTRGAVTVSAHVPLAELENYQSFLKSVTAGRGSYDLEFNSYEPVPTNIQERIVAEYRPRAEED